MPTFAACLRFLRTGLGNDAAPAGGDAPVSPAQAGPGPLVDQADIVLDAEAASAQALFAAIGQHMQSVHRMDGAEIARALEHREHIGSTGIGEGIAVPHARVRGLDRIWSMYIRMRRPLAFDAPDGVPVRHFFVLLAPKQAAQEHLDVLARVTQAVTDPEFRRVIEGCVFAKDVGDAFDTLARRDAAARARRASVSMV
jgi:nitrogen PTS system EIIA component